MKIKAATRQSVLLTGFLSLLTVFSLTPVVCATEITTDYAGGTITNGMLINPASNAISITGTTTLSGRSAVGSENYSFRTANGNAVTIASGAVKPRETFGAQTAAQVPQPPKKTLLTLIR